MNLLHKIFITISIIILFYSFTFSQLTPKDAIAQMKKGINLGNTLEPPLEGNWGNPSTQEYFFDLYKNEGFDFVRIPVRWDKHMGTASPYKIDETWFKRVEQILDWGLSKGLYIIVNSHHDDWIKNNYASSVNRARFDSLWAQVSTRFKDKSEKLLFEVLNEPHGLTKAQNDEMHARVLTIIRKTNPTRLVIFQGNEWGGSTELISAAIPNDKYLIGSFHSYDPYLFGLEGQGTWGTSTDISALRSKFQSVKNWSDKNNIPVFLGEFGAVRSCDFNSRMKHYKTYVELSHTFGFAPAAWDDGGNFRIMNRSARTWDDDVKDILVKSSELSPKTPNLQILQDTIIRLSWINPTNDYDSIFIERRLATSTYQKVAGLPGNAISFHDIKLPQNKEYYYRVIGHYKSKPDLYSYPQKILLPFYVAKVRKFFKGKPFEIPGKIEAEDFDEGGEGFTYHDSDDKNITGEYRPNTGIDIYKRADGAYLVAENYPGEWLEYTVNITKSGTYQITVVIAAFAGGGTFTVQIGDKTSEQISSIPTYSWVNTKNVTFTMELTEGQKIMRVTFVDKPMLNIDSFEFTRIIPTNNIAVNNESEIKINKTNSFINVSSNHEKLISKFRIISISGKEIINVNNPGNNFNIQTSEFNPGIYIVQAISGNTQIIKKILIQ